MKKNSTKTSAICISYTLSQFSLEWNSIDATALFEKSWIITCEHTQTHTQWIKLSRNRLSNKNVCVYEILNEHTHTFIREKKQKQNEKQSMNWIKLNGIYTIQSCESIEFFFAIAGDEFFFKKSVMNRFHPHKQPSSSSSSSEWFIDESIELKL